MKLKLIKAKKKDTLFFYKLRNDKNNRKNSVSTKKIKFSNHNNWFIKTLNKKSNFIYIIKKRDLNCGYLRYEKKLKFFNVSICIDKKFRNKNIALSALIIGDRKVKLATNSGLKAISISLYSLFHLSVVPGGTVDFIIIVLCSKP